MLNKLERKIGKYAIPRLTLWLILGYVIGYTLRLLTRTADNPDGILVLLRLEPYFIIFHHQFWRLITWVIVPPEQNIFFAIIMCMFYYSLGNMMERTWGTFRYNLYIFGGIIFTILGAFLLYGGLALYVLKTHNHIMGSVGHFFSTYYINMSIFLAFAACYPDQQVMLYFIFPIKIKFLAIVYVVMIALGAFPYSAGGWPAVLCYSVAVLSSLLNFLVFWLANKKRDLKNASRRRRFTNAYNSGRNESRRSARSASGWNAYSGTAQSTQSSSQSASAGSKPNSRAKVISRHRCAVCGKSELDDATMEFRFCSKCNGNYEYCREHLFTHTHVK